MLKIFQAFGCCGWGVWGLIVSRSSLYRCALKTSLTDVSNSFARFTLDFIRQGKVVLFENVPQTAFNSGISAGGTEFGALDGISESLSVRLQKGSCWGAFRV